MGELLEIAKVAVQPAMKLLDMCGSAIGTAYEPRHKRKMADATAYEISVIGDAMRNAADLPIVYTQDGIAINSEDFNRLMQRAGTRLVLQETIKQHNIEGVIDHAYEILMQEESCSAEPVEQGWINRFFDSVADISDEDLQKLWGKILAGETKQPHSYSLRTLETIKNLSKYEAELFQKIVPYVVNMNENKFLPASSALLDKYGISYKEIMNLDECGLINSSALVSINLNISKTDPVAFYNNARLVMLHNVGIDKTEISIAEYGLTGAGKELFGIINCNSNAEYICDLAEEIANKNAKKIKAAVHKINYFENNRIIYDDPALYEFPIRKNEVTE